MGRLTAAAAAALLCATAMACEDLPDIAEGVCGNRLLEPAAGEACDGSAPEASGAGLPSACGAPGTAFACQYVHDATHACPAGYGAGVDGLCRHGTGVLAAAAAHGNATAPRLSVADIDGNGRLDLLTSDPLGQYAQVTYLGSGMQPIGAAAIDLGRALHAPVAGRFGSDAAADVAIPDAAGLLVLRGGADAQLSSKVYAAIELGPKSMLIEVPAAAVVPPAQSSDVAGLSIIGALLEVDGDLVIAGGQGNMALGRIPNAKLTDVAGVLTMDLDPPSFPFQPISDEVIVALGDGRLAAITPHHDLEVRRERFLDLAPERELLSRPFAGQRSGPARFGVVTRRGGNLYITRVHLGTAAEGLLIDNGGDADEFLVGPDTGDADEEVLGWTDYTLAGQPSQVLVQPRQVRVLIPGLLCPAPDVDPCFAPLATNPNPLPWSVAAMNVQRGTVVAGSSLATGLDVLVYNDGATVFNTESLPTDAPVRDIAIGDFDGDTQLDYLLSVRAKPAGCDDDARLLVSWGSALGYPTAPQLVGRVPGLGQAIPLGFATQLKLDGISDVAFTKRCDDTTLAGLLFGDGSRQLQSPYPLSVDLPPHYITDDNGGAVPLGTLDIGAPAGGTPDGIDDLLAIVGAPPNIGVLPILVGPDSDLEPGEPFAVTEVTDPIQHALTAGSAQLHRADMDGDGDFDLVLVMSDIEVGDGGVLVRPRVWIGTHDGGALAFEERGSAAEAFAWKPGTGTEGIDAEAGAYFTGSTLLTEVTTADLDGDGWRDVVVRLETPLAAGDPQFHVFAFLGGAAGQLVETAIALPEGSVRGVAALQESPSGATLAVATNDAVWLCAAGGCGPSGIVAEGENIGLAAADFDADGVVDLAVARLDGVDFYRQTTAQDGVANAP